MYHLGKTTMVKSALDFAHLPVPCPHCGKEGQQKLTDLVASDSVACPYCGTIIDISSQDWCTAINEAVDLYKSFRRPGDLP